MNVATHPRGKKWIPSLFSIQGKEDQTTILLHFLIPAQRILFVANRMASHSSSPHSPPEAVVVEEGNDHIKEMDLSPGGRLQLFYKVWLANDCHPRVAHILKHGYEIILKSPIELSRNPTIRSGYANQQKQNFLLECVQQMLQKKAIVPVKMHATQGFHSRLFLVPKPGKKLQPVIDLSVLNNHLTVPTFKMETAEVIRNSICKGEWVVSVDLTGTYFHIPIHQRSQNLLRFYVGGHSFQFRVLPFGIVTAPL